MFDHIEAFYQPGNVQEALRLLRKVGKHGRILAGATDIVTRAERADRFLIDITRIGLDYIRAEGKGCVIGSTATMTALEQSAVVLKFGGGILAKAAATCGSIQNRNMATVGGNLANASPAADTAAVLLAFDAQLVAANARRKRQIPLADFYAGPHKTVLNGDLLLEIHLPALPGGGRWGWSFQKLGRTETDIALVNAAVGLQFGPRGRIIAARVGLGSVGPMPMRGRQAETLLAGSVLSEDLLASAGNAVMQEVTPISDGRASAEYRREMSGVLTRRALRECAAQAGVVL